MMRKLLLGFVVVLLLCVAGVVVFLSKGKTLGERHQDYAEADFAYDTSNFADYINYSRERIGSARVDAVDTREFENLLPFVLEPDASCPRTAEGKAEQGIVLIHGLFESGYSMQPLGKFLQSQCFYVLGLLLPDHASRPGDFLSTDWQEWVQAAHFATQQLALHAEKIIVSGHSTGGALAILEGEQNAEVDALILFAPALAVTPAAKYARFVVPLGKLFPKAAWAEVASDAAVYRYESITLTAASEIYSLIQAVHAAENSQVQALPVLTIVSLQDNTVNTPTTLEFMQRNTNAASHTLLYSQHPYPGNERMTVVPSSTPAQGILSLSHLGLMTPPEDYYYGRDGEYRACGHYGDASNLDFQHCKNGERSYYGEATPENLQQGRIERIAFNPYYPAMLAEVLRFLK